MVNELIIIVAADEEYGIGINNTLPWHLPEDLTHFKNTTSGHPIIMGRKTFDSIGRPLPNRRNIVVTNQATWQHDGVEVAHSINDATKLIGDQKAFIIGGAQIYQSALPLVNKIMITKINHVFHCDAFFPAIDPTLWREVERHDHHSVNNNFDYAFVTYQKK